MLKVIIVEDEDLIRKGLIHTVDWLNLDCTIVGEASDGEEGLKLINDLRPDLVITDIKMPLMDGIEMLEQAKSLHRFHSIILTSYSDFEYAKKAISLKVYEYLLKPIDEEKLIQIVEKVKIEINDEKIIGDIKEKTKINNNLSLVDLDIYIFSKEENNYYVEEALREIKENYHTKISIETIASKLGVSPSYLSRKFRDVTSQTFVDMLNKYRVQKAVELLNAGKYRVYEISDMLGFNEYKHFSNVFKKYTQLTPSEFAKNISNVIQKGK